MTLTNRKELMSFKTFLKEQAVAEFMTEAGRLDVSAMFTKVSLEPLGVEKVDSEQVSEPHQRFVFIATTRNGTNLRMEMKLDELLNPIFIHSLQRLAAS
ncbi:hypothetical protein [Vibrio owensii]|uniref:hypothetical protein n=2 Tax=Vibrio owensii TaxID=696485 RepID=UPI0012D46BE2|nr:hypothetical protein [Vibrio owensii]